MHFLTFHPGISESLLYFSHLYIYIIPEDKISCNMKYLFYFIAIEKEVQPELHRAYQVEQMVSLSEISPFLYVMEAPGAASAPWPLQA